MKRLFLLLAVVAAVAGFVMLRGCSKPTPAQAELERQFEQMMKGATLVGYSTSLNREGLSGEERYGIEKVTKVAGETWLIHARMRHNGKEMTVPVPVTMKWAGDTPMITLTDLTIPGMGTFTARVLLYRDQYAGTWSGGNHGGQMFGKIVHGQ